MNATGGLPNLLRAILGNVQESKSPQMRPSHKETENMNKQQISAFTRSTQVHGSRSSSETTVSSKACRVLWIDGVGGFLCVDRDEVVIGQATGGADADITIVGDLSRQAAAIRRSGSDYLLQPLQSMTLNDRPVDRAQLLQDGHLLQLGKRVKLRFSKPNPLSATARLDLVSLNRWKPNVDGVLLLSDSCVIGPNAGSHVMCPGWKSEMLMFRHGDGWCFRTLVEVDVDGQKTKGQIPIVSGMRIRGEDFSLSVE